MREMTQSELNSYLETKPNAELLQLHEARPKSTTAANLLPYWADPTLLSKTEWYQISRHYRLPDEFEVIAYEKGWLFIESHIPNIRVHNDSGRNYIVLISPDNIHICFYKEEVDSENRFFTLKSEKLSVNGNTPFFHMFPDQSVVAISTSGLVYLWKDYAIDSCVEYQIPLISRNESITSIEFINEENAAIGSSTGEIYLLKINHYKFAAFSFYMQKTIASYIFGLLSHRHPPSLTNIEKSSSTDAVVGIHSIGNKLYILTNKFMQLWRIGVDSDVKLLFNTNIEAEVIASVAVHIPDHVSKNNIQPKILDMSVIKNEEMAILVSYSVPGLGEYVQYALITFLLNNHTPMPVKYTASIPYSAIPSTLKCSPRVIITNTLAFVTFDQTVIAVSVDRKSVFEEAVVLYDDQVLHTEVCEKGDLATATIYTISSGILEFEIDTCKICLPEDTGNIYAESVDDEVKRDGLIFKSKLEQAVFFGASSEPLLQFFLRPEGNVVSTAVMDLSDDIFNSKCALMPPTERSDLYIDSRYLFMKKIVSVLRENHLLTVLSNENKSKLMQQTELCYLALVLWKSGYMNDTILGCWIELMKKIVTIDSTVFFRLPQEDFFLDHTTRIVDFVQSYVSFVRQLKGSEKNPSHQMQLLVNANETLMKVMRKSQTFEEKYIVAYGMEHIDFDYSISGQFREMLFDLFQTNIAYIQESASNDMLLPESLESIKKLTFELVLLLSQSHLDLILSKKGTEEYYSKYMHVRKEVMDGLCKSGLYEEAIELAEKHKDIPALVASVNASTLSSDTIQEKNLYFIQLFKQDYFDCLLKYIDQNSGCEEEDTKKTVLELCSLYPTYAEKLLARNELKISWVYHLKRKNYEKAAQSLQMCLEREGNLDEKKRAEYMGWMEMVNAAISCRNNNS